MIFCQARDEEAREVLRVLDCYDVASGQVINKEKSSKKFGGMDGWSISFLTRARKYSLSPLRWHFLTMQCHVSDCRLASIKSLRGSLQCSGGMGQIGSRERLG